MSGELVMARRPKSIALGQRLANLHRWRESMDPTQGLTPAKARLLALDYPQGRMADLMWTFGAPFVGIESQDPDYLALIERRQARLLEMDWDIRTADDSPEATRQAEVLRQAYDSFDNITEAVEHLASASYRGFAHLEVDVPGRELRVLPQWNWVREGAFGRWAYNPEAQSTSFEAMAEEHILDPAQHWVIVREVRRPIGAFALLKFARGRGVDLDWDTFSAIFGIPGWVIIGPPNVPEDKELAYEQAALDIAEGGSGYLPYGSTAEAAGSPQGSAPFKDRLDHLTQKLILAGTGGMLTMLNDATGLGSGQAESHQDTFAQIARAEAAKISETLQRGIDRQVLRAAGLLRPGRRQLAWFALAAQEEADAGAVVQDAATLATAGYIVDLDQIEERTGYKVSLKPEAPAATGLFNSDRHPAHPPGTPQSSAKPRSGGGPTQEPGSGEAPLVGQNREEALPALAADLAPAREAMESVLATLEREGATEDEVRAAVEEGLRLLDEDAPAILRMGDLAGRLEEMLAEAVITGAANRRSQSAPTTP